MEGLEGLKRLGGLKGLVGIAHIESLKDRLSTSRAEIPVKMALPGESETTAEKLEKAAVQGVIGTLPERIVWKWLLDHGHAFEVQYQELGGRMLPGGAVVDFIVYDLAPNPAALRVQGSYWHGPAFPGRMARDDEQAGRLRDDGYRVVDLWEQDIYQAVLYDRLTAYIMGQVDMG